MSVYIFTRTIAHSLTQILREKEDDFPILKGARESAHIDLRGLSSRDTVIAHRKPIDEIAEICARGATYCEIEILYPRGISKTEENRLRSSLVYRKAAEKLKIRDILEIADQIDIRIVPYTVHRADEADGSRGCRRGRKQGSAGRDPRPPENGRVGDRNPGETRGPETPFQEALKDFGKEDVIVSAPRDITTQPSDRTLDGVSGDGSGEALPPFDGQTEREAPGIQVDEVTQQAEEALGPEAEDLEPSEEALMIDRSLETGGLLKPEEMRETETLSPETDPETPGADVQIRDNDAAEAATNTDTIPEENLPDAEVSETDKT